MAMTLEDVAKLCGVSRSTVSRVINGDSNVNEKTRTKVMEVVKSIGFQPNLAARGLAVGQTKVLGLVIPQGVSAIFTDPFFPLVIQGVSYACNSRDYSVMLWLADPEYERRTIRQILYNGLIDGVIVSSMLMNDPIIEALAESKLPFVTIGRHPLNDNINYVDVDNRSGGREATLHLLRLGHRRVATITGPINLVAGSERFEGYLDALRERGIPRNNDLIVEGDFTDAGGHLAMQRLLAQKTDAVFVASDAMALGAMRAVQEAGFRVPEDVAIVGFDDLSIAVRAVPPLTTIRQPIKRLGAVAAETLIEMLTYPDGHPQRVVLPVELVIRASCGA
jgi:LacI family transcriptional regulator